MFARAILIATAVLALGAACSSSNTAAPVGSPTDRASALRAFAACMQQHGVTIPTPSATPGGRGLGRLFSGINRNDPKVLSGFQACRAQFGGFRGGGGFGRRFGSPTPTPTSSSNSV